MLLTTPDDASREGRYYSAHEVRNLPGCVQRPRIPFAVAAAGPRAFALAARHGQGWVTFGDPRLPDDAQPAESMAALRRQVERLEEAAATAGRRVQDRIRLFGATPASADPLESVDAFVDFAGAHAEMGFTEIVSHWPIPDSIFAANLATYEKIATEAPAQLARSSQTHS